ncbi:alpha/beta hydrolase [Streptomyces sp. NA04227]|uniref:alpha/beta fold hydrolase n=1 Tax=Streptomyces sp. NA04227 TaxID=2742136 RepID=UPI0015927B10|nr:alpha/beta hydrolase [Streptomyces sp. NA04227]QKW07318.1 alpha/beta hydrolase [Streptomyces sp. NA04227]
MPTFSAPDGTRLAYRVVSGGGNGDPALGRATDPAHDPTLDPASDPALDPVICLPGGPTDSGYLGDLGGLSAHRPLVLLDLRGTGGSAVPEDTSSYRCDRLVDDVEALRAHLGLARADLLAHCAGANIVAQYVARYPHHVGKLALITPSTRAVDIPISAETRRETALLRKDEPWFPAAFAALESLAAGKPAEGAAEAIAPFFCGRWDAAAQELHALGAPSNQEAVAAFGSEGAFDPAATRAALAAHTGQVLLLAGEFDLNSPPQSTAAFAGLFAATAAEFVVQAGAGHYPWLDDAEGFVEVVGGFLGRGRAESTN